MAEKKRKALIFFCALFFLFSTVAAINLWYINSPLQSVYRVVGEVSTLVKSEYPGGWLNADTIRSIKLTLNASIAMAAVSAGGLVFSVYKFTKNK